MGGYWEFPLSPKGFRGILEGLVAGSPSAPPSGAAQDTPSEDIMYAVIQTGGKQYRVSEGDILRVELLEKDPKQAVVFDQVLLAATESAVKVGQPTLKGATVEAEVIRYDRAKKVFIYKKKRTTTYQRTQGHRQGFTEVRIKSIKA